MAKMRQRRLKEKQTTSETAKVKTRIDEVYREAARLFRENGYLRTTMNDIAQALAIQKGSLYYYVKDKESLLFEILDRITDIFLETVDSLSLENLSSQEKLTSLIHQHFLNIMEYRNEVPLLIYEAKNLQPNRRERVINKRREYENIFLNVIREGMGDGTFLEHNQHVVAFFILGGVFWFSQWFSHEQMDAQQVTEQSLVSVFFNGLLKHRPLDSPAKHDS